MSYGISKGTLLAATDLAAANNTSDIDLNYARGLSIFVVNTLVADTVKTFADADVSVANNTITIATHNFATGRKVAATTDGVLPGGLSATDYYVIKVDASTIKLATSAANALAGTAVDITSAAGGGTHTLTPAAIGSASQKLQGSHDGTNYFDIASTSTNVTATANIMWNIDAPYYPKIRVVTAMAAGQFTSAITYNVLRYGRAR